MIDEFKKFNSSLPLAISSDVEMVEPNEHLNIFEGKFILENVDCSLTIQGRIWFNWLPNIGILFEGIIIDKKGCDNYLKWLSLPYVLSSNKNIYGQVRILELENSEEIKLFGQFVEKCIWGDKSIYCKRIRFHIANLKKINNEVAKFDELTAQSIRLALENDKYSILIDQRRNFDFLYKKLKKNGGFIILYNCELIPKKQSIDYYEKDSILNQLGYFLSFINGFWIGATFIQGIHEDNTIWSEYNDDRIDQFKSVRSWFGIKSIKGINRCWKKFSELWATKDDKEFIKKCIDWYINANNSDIQISIIITQASLELIYNKFIIEEYALISGKDSENMAASNKLRLLLKILGITDNYKLNTVKLSEFVKNKKDYIDEIDGFVQIRNSIIHSQKDKRTKLIDIPNSILYEVQQLGLHYLELCILKIIDFKGPINSRLNGEIIC